MMLAAIIFGGLILLLVVKMYFDKKGVRPRSTSTPLAGASPIRRSWLYLGILAAIIVVAVLALWMSGRAHAAEILQCQAHDKMLADLAQLFQESVVESGVMQNDAGEQTGIFELTGSSKGGWTVIVTDGHRMSCIKANGGHLTRAEIKPPGRDT